MEATNEVRVSLSETQLSRLLDVQEFDKTKWDETCEHIFELGLSARENSIKATRKRKQADELAKNVDAFNAFLKLSPETVNDPVKLLGIMQKFGLGINSLATEVQAQAKSA